jgi:hypothetical protein
MIVTFLKGAALLALFIAMAGSMVFRMGNRWICNGMSRFERAAWWLGTLSWAGLGLVLFAFLSYYLGGLFP